MRAWAAMILLLNSLPLQAEPRIKGAAVQNGAEPWFCRVLFLDEKNQPIGMCSSSATKKNELTLSGHCVDKLSDKKFSVSVQCGDLQGLDLKDLPNHIMETRQISIHRDYAPEVKKPNFQPAQNDRCTIAFTTDLPVKETIQFASDEELTAVISNSADFECRIGGYGRDNDNQAGSAKFAALDTDGTWNVDRLNGSIEVRFDKGIDAEECTKFSSWAMIPGPKTEIENMKVLYQVTKMSGLVGLGDSGGPLYCRKKNGVSWKLVGIASASGSTFLKISSKMRYAIGWAIARVEYPKIALKDYKPPTPQVLSSPTK